jgi:hypothetical protein
MTWHQARPRVAGGVGVAGAAGSGAVVDVGRPWVVVAACVGEGVERGS